VIVRRKIPRALVSLAPLTLKISSPQLKGRYIFKRFVLKIILVDFNIDKRSEYLFQPFVDGEG
jgi:hypothetical protein